MVSDRALLRVARKLSVEGEGREGSPCGVPPRSLRALSPCRSQKSDCSLASIMA